ncbi:RNA-binding protein [Patescibacteria group bacterium]|nr:RNA-binding protein [Patescibacteria group bacterium]
MAKKLFVGSLPFETTSEELDKLFAGIGDVESANIVTDRMSGRSRGFGFVEMAKDEDATKAVEKLNGSEIGGRKIVVNEARPREERPSNG